MHLLTIIRAYLGVSQTILAKEAGITQPDLSEIESKEPYGKIFKYQRLSRCLDIPVDTILKSDYRSIPESFFEKHPHVDYLPLPTTPDQRLGREGEEYIFQREQARVARIYPALSKLVLPYFKMPGDRPGYDILTYDDAGQPYCLEVKTSVQDTGGFRITNHELDVAQRKLAAGERYDICYISNWGTDAQQEQDITFSSLMTTHNIMPCYYFCKPIPKPKTGPVSGLAYFRRLRGIRQADIAHELDITASDWSLYETGKRNTPVNIYLKASEILNATVDELLQTYIGSEVLHG